MAKELCEEYEAWLVGSHIMQLDLIMASIPLHYDDHDHLHYQLWPHQFNLRPLIDVAKCDHACTIEIHNF